MFNRRPVQRQCRACRYFRIQLPNYSPQYRGCKGVNRGFTGSIGLRERGAEIFQVSWQHRVVRVSSLVYWTREEECRRGFGRGLKRPAAELKNSLDVDGRKPPRKGKSAFPSCAAIGAIVGEADRNTSESIRILLVLKQQRKHLTEYGEF